MLTSNTDLTSFAEESVAANWSEMQIRLYKNYLNDLLPPWENKTEETINIINERVQLESISDKILQRRYSKVLNNLPSVGDFSTWAKELVYAHSSGVIHPLFKFLKEEADYFQLREFIRQESPFDLFFSDILCRLLPGVYDRFRSEIGNNFWDELGRGNENNNHRHMRLDMMKELGLDLSEHVTNPENYLTEEIALANAYFKLSMNRSRLGQAIGALLATELAVPGRMSLVLGGWLRLGVPRSKLRYIADHITIDIEHGEGWLNNVVLPLIEKHPFLIEEIVKGMLERLDAADRVCDSMLKYLKAFDAKN